jgi:hypothetical protein
MENQGKRPDQIKFHEDVSFYAIIGLIITLGIIIFTK